MIGVTQEYLKSLLSYDPLTGEFHWRTRRGRIAAGTLAGTVDEDGYTQICINFVRYRAHRLVFLYVDGYQVPDGMDVDHDNGDTGDNRYSNLRIATRGQNMYNAKRRKDNRSGVKGVGWHGAAKKWRARLRVDGKEISLGLFNRLEDAEAAVTSARSAAHREFSRHA
jgi:hypothetical protein